MRSTLVHCLPSELRSHEVLNSHPSLHLIVDRTCERERSVKRDAAKAERKRAANKGVEILDDDGDVEKDEEPEYPPRPHGSFDE